MSMKGSILTMRGYNQFVVDKNTEGVSQAESLTQPPNGNCLNWVLGHIILHRNPMLTLLGEEPVWTREQCEPYARGSQPLTDPASAAEIEDMRAAVIASHERIAAALERATDDALNAPVEPGSDTTIGSRLLGLQFHEAYHAGQLGVLRRIAGHEGVLK